MSNTLIIFGATGDLTKRKLIPSLYELFRKGRLRKPFWIVGFSRTQLSDSVWRSNLEESTRFFQGKTFEQKIWDEFARSIYFQPGHAEQLESYLALSKRLEQLEQGDSNEDVAEYNQGESEKEGSEGETINNRIYYLATAPGLYQPIVQRIGQSGLAKEVPHQKRRLVIEKPFGTDLKSAQELNRSIHQVFTEHQIYRIDHYLGKDTVNNLLVFRFANTMFEPIWNRNYIEHIQMTASEEVLIGNRASYYEQAGILRDMFQNHLLQLLTLTLMEAPARFEAKSVRDEKVKVLHSMRRMSQAEAARNSIRGQYRLYRNEPDVAPNSAVATFGAIRLMVDNWRWKDVPIFLRSGKGMSCRTTQILIQFRQPPHLMFQHHVDCPQGANQLLIQIQPAEGIQLYFQSKVPDTEMQMRTSSFHFNFNTAFQGELPESYQRLLLDVMQGDASLFARNDEVEAAWKIIDPFQTVWDSGQLGDPDFYEVGCWGPSSSHQWIEQFGHNWFDSCPLV